MPVLRRAHDHHRDLRARLLAAHASNKRDQNRHLMMITTAASQYRNAPRSCRSSNGHGAAWSDRQFGPLRNMPLPISAPSLGRNDLLNHRTGLDHRAAIHLPQLAHRARGAQIPIAPAVPPHVPPARFPPLEAFGRRPSACAATSIIGPASETLHRNGSQRRRAPPRRGISVLAKGPRGSRHRPVVIWRRL
jgi:hypothetical protein